MWLATGHHTCWQEVVSCADPGQKEGAGAAPQVRGQLIYQIPAPDPGLCRGPVYKVLLDLEMFPLSDDPLTTGSEEGSLAECGSDRMP